MIVKYISHNVAKVTIGDWTVYIDNSTEEHIISSHKEGYKKVVTVYSKPATFNDFEMDVIPDDE
jgi:hypothetical protein